MRQITRKSYLAVEVVLYIALHSGETAIRGREICEYHGVTLRYLEQILQLLVRHKILKGVRGPKGGYLLAKEKRKITLVDIYRAMAEQDSTEMMEKTPLFEEAVQWVVNDVDALVEQHLCNITILDLYEKALAVMSVNSPDKNEFSI